MIGGTSLAQHASRVVAAPVIGVNQAQTAPSGVIGLRESKHALFWATANTTRPFVYLFIHRAKAETKGREREIASRKCRALADRPTAPQWAPFCFVCVSPMNWMRTAVWANSLAHFGANNAHACLSACERMKNRCMCRQTTHSQCARQSARRRRAHCVWIDCEVKVSLFINTSLDTGITKTYGELCITHFDQIAGKFSLGMRETK